MPTTPTINPTAETYAGLNKAYAFYNRTLFAGALPFCLITLHRKAKAYGYFAGDRFGAPDGKAVTDEIALNPSHFKDRTTKQTHSTLVHEMAHLWQHRFGTPSRSAYHNKEWAAKMIEIGLHPSDTGKVGGKQTGQSVSHYIVEGGAFDIAFDKLDGKAGATAFYVELWNETTEKKKAAQKKTASKTKYSCEECDVNAWAKPDTLLICGVCMSPMCAA